jgi:hypothetical protein
MVRREYGDEVCWNFSYAKIVWDTAPAVNGVVGMSAMRN